MEGLEAESLTQYWSTVQQTATQAGPAGEGVLVGGFVAGVFYAFWDLVKYGAAGNGDAFVPRSAQSVREQYHQSITTPQQASIKPQTVVNTQASNNSSTNSQSGGGKYSHLKEPRKVESGGKTTSAQRKRILAENKKQNGGKLKSDGDGRDLNPPSKSEKGKAADMNQAEVDHVDPASKGGSNSNSNLRVISKEENLKKGNRTD